MANMIILLTRTNGPYTAQMYRKTDIQPVNKRQKRNNECIQISSISELGAVMLSDYLRSYLLKDGRTEGHSAP